MEILSNLGALLGGSWASGVNLYLTIAVLGILDKMNVLSLPGDLEVISNPFIIGIAILMYLVEFFADKIPLVDSAWDSIHTFIRPIGGAALSYMAMADMGPVAQIPAALLSGTVALDSHLTKATTRAAINTSPEPFTNSIASVSEDAMVVGVIWMIIHHPIIAGILVILFIFFSIWFLKMMFKFLKKVFSFLTGRGRDETYKKQAVQT